MLLKLVLCNKRSHNNEELVSYNKSSPCILQLEKS